MVYNTGPLIEGVVSPTASSTTRQTALDSAATPSYTSPSGYNADQNQYRLAQNLFLAGGTTANTGNTLSNTQLGQQGSLQPTLDGRALMAAGWTATGSGGWMHAGTGKVIDSSGNPVDTTTTTDPPTGTNPIDDPHNPDTEGPGGGTNPNDELGRVSQEAMRAEIEALQAQYGLDIASIAALGGEIGQRAQFLLAQLQRDQEFAQEDLEGNLVARGVFRSGIAARDTGRLQGDFAMQRAGVEMNKGSQLRQLAERAGIAKIGLARGKADVISMIDAGNLPTELRQLMLNELSGLTPAQIQETLDGARQPLPPLRLTDEDLAADNPFWVQQ